MNKPFKLLFLADLSGRESQGLSEPATLQKRKSRRIDKDNFDEVFAKLGVKLRFAFDQTPVSFDTLEALHPDHLVEHLEVFAKYRQLKRQLKKADGVQRVADALGASSDPTASKPSEAKVAELASGENLLDAVLNESPSNIQTGDLSGGFDLQSLIRSAVAPHIVERQDPRVDTLQTLLNAAMEDTLRGILHTDTFRSLESAWSAVDFLNRRLDTDKACHFYLLDVSREELSADLGSKGGNKDIQQSGLYRNLVEAMSAPGERHFDALLVDHYIEPEEVDLTLLSALGQIAAGANAKLLINGSEQLAGCDKLSTHPDPIDWQDPRPEGFEHVWHTFRASQFGGSVCLAGPRYLQRLPYGQRSSPTEAFPFEELSDASSHEDFLWGGGASLLAYLMVQGFVETGTVGVLGKQGIVDDLPICVLTDEEGDAMPIPCAEVLLTDAGAARLAEQGFCVVRSVKNQNSIQIERLTDFHTPSN